MNICMIGSGYVGLVSAVCFSNFGWNVSCIDKDDAKIAQLREGRSPIYEPGLDELLARNIKAGRIRFSTDLSSAAANADLVFLAVGTPMRRGDGYADLSYVYQAVEELAPHLSDFTVITTKSTVPVGTSREIERRLRLLRPDADFAVCSNPEFLREGSAILDFTHPDRVLVGLDDDPRARAVMERVYEPLRLRNSPVLFVSRESAELAKYAGNSFLALKISFINEIADLCEEVGANVQQVATAIGADRRIGDLFLHPGPGYGGSCFPKDVSALVRTAREARSPLTIIEQVQKVNDERKIAMAARIERAAGGVRGKTIAILGVTFKPNTDDMRDAPGLVIIPLLRERGATVRVYDPQGRAQAEPLLGAAVEWRADALDVVQGADVAVVLTEWQEFRALDLKAVRDAMRGDVLVDLRNVYRPDLARAAGFRYTSLGRERRAGEAS